MVIGGSSLKFYFVVTEKFFPLTRDNSDYCVINISDLGELFRRCA